MAWPPALPTVGFKSEGLTNFVWGTDGWSAQSLGGSYIVNSIRATERVEPAIIENGSGLSAVQILLIDGLDYEITVVDSTSVTPPVSGTIATVLIPNLIGPGGNSISSVAVSALVVNANVSLAKKQPGERVIAVKTYTLFTVS